MTRNKFLASIATLSILAGAPALAGPGGGHGGGMGGGPGAMGGINHGQGNAFGHGNSTITTGNATRIRGVDRSAMGVKSSSKLTGVNNGLTVVDASGATVGTITGVATRGDGSVHHVQMTLTDGTIITLKPSNLSLVNGVLTTNSLTSTFRANSQGAAHASVQGLAHASPMSALGFAGRTDLSTLTLGMSVVGSGGNTLGPITQLINNRSNALVGIRVDLTDGGIVTIPASTLTLAGGVLSTTFVPK